MSDALPPPWSRSSGEQPRPASPPYLLYRGEPETVRDAVEAGVVLRQPQWGVASALLMLPAVLVSAVAVAFLMFVVWGENPPAGPALVLGTGVPWLTMALLPAVLTARLGNGPRTDLGLRLRGTDLGWGLLGGVVALLLASATAWVTAALVGDFSSSAGDAALDIRAQTVWFVLFLIGVVIVAPVAEEILFRGFVWGALAKAGLPPWGATVVSALIFAGYHFEWKRLLLLFGTGLVFGYVRQRTGSTGAAIVAHMVNNAAGGLGLLFLS